MNTTPVLSSALNTIVNLLGGPAMLSRPIHNELDLVHAAAAGVSVQAVRHLQRHLRLTNRELSEMLAMSESTLTRREQAEQPLSRDEGEKAIQLSAMVAKGVEVFDNEADFHRWLQLENPALGGIRPQELLSSALGREQVREVLTRIQWGIFS